jgi:hypothetical protein
MGGMLLRLARAGRLCRTSIPNSLVYGAGNAPIGHALLLSIGAPIILREVPDWSAAGPTADVRLGLVPYLAYDDMSGVGGGPEPVLVTSR